MREMYVIFRSEHGVSVSFHLHLKKLSRKITNKYIMKNYLMSLAAFCAILTAAAAEPNLRQVENAAALSAGKEAGWYECGERTSRGQSELFYIDIPDGGKMEVALISSDSSEGKFSAYVKKGEKLEVLPTAGPPSYFPKMEGIRAIASYQTEKACRVYVLVEDVQEGRHYMLLAFAHDAAGKAVSSSNDSLTKRNISEPPTKPEGEGRAESETPAPDKADPTSRWTLPESPAEPEGDSGAESETPAPDKADPTSRWTLPGAPVKPEGKDRAESEAPAPAKPESDGHAESETPAPDKSDPTSRWTLPESPAKPEGKDRAESEAPTPAKPEGEGRAESETPAPDKADPTSRWTLPESPAEPEGDSGAESETPAPDKADPTSRWTWPMKSDEDDSAGKEKILPNKGNSASKDEPQPDGGTSAKEVAPQPNESTAPESSTEQSDTAGTQFNDAFLPFELEHFFSQPLAENYVLWGGVAGGLSVAGGLAIWLVCTKNRGGISISVMYPDGRHREYRISMRTIADQPPIIAGSASHCTLRIDDIKVSSQHFMLEVNEEGICVYDLNSENGTIIHGQRVSSYSHPHARGALCLSAGDSRVSISFVKDMRNPTPPSSLGGADSAPIMPLGRRFPV